MRRAGLNKEFSTKGVLFFITLIFFNLLTHETAWNLLISIPQFCWVLTLLLLRKTQKAFFYHLVFSVTCLAIPFSQLTNPGESIYGLFNYSKLKIIGPLAYYHLISIAIFLIAIKQGLKIDKRSLFFSLIKTLVFLAILGIGFGIIGLIFFEYYLQHFISYSVYMIVLLLNAILLAKFHSNYFLLMVFKAIVSILIAAPIASIVLEWIGKTMLYGNSTVAVVNEAGYFSIVLIFAIYQFKRIFLPLIAVSSTFLLLLDGGMGGKGIIIVLCALGIFILSTFTGFYRRNYRKRVQLVKGILIPSVVFMVLKIQSYFANAENKLFIYKFESFILMFEAFKGMEYLDVIPASPRIRIISLINILDEQIKNPIKFLFGSGYGSYFYDESNLFRDIDLRSAFRPIEVKTGKFGRPHDTLVAVPLANGFIGLALLIRLVYRYILRMKHNFLAFAVIPWLFLTFYYNSQFGLVGLIMLYSSEQKLNLLNQNEI